MTTRANQNCFKMSCISNTIIITFNSSAVVEILVQDEFPKGDNLLGLIMKLFFHAGHQIQFLLQS